MNTKTHYKQELSMKNLVSLIFLFVVATSESNKLACNLVEIFILKSVILTELSLENVLAR